MKLKRSKGPERAKRHGKGNGKFAFQLDADGLYKYCDQRGIDILQSLRLKVTPPIQFNDPFEFMPKVDFEITPEKIKTDLRSVTDVWSYRSTVCKISLDFETFSQSVSRTI